jgi:hypothetical protein
MAADRHAHQCIFCGSGKVEVTLASPEEKAPVILNIGVCLVDTILIRCATVKHQRLAQVGQDMAAAASAIQDARRRARHERNERDFKAMRQKQTLDPEIEVDAGKKLVEEEEERIARAET